MFTDMVGYQNMTGKVHCMQQDPLPISGNVRLPQALDQCDVDGSCKGVVNHACDTRIFYKCLEFGPYFSPGHCNYVKGM